MLSLNDIARHSDLRCQPMAFLGTTAQDVILNALLGTTTWDVNLHGFAWHNNPKRYLHDIAWHNDLRCQPLWHCLAQQPKMLSSMTLLGTTTWDVNLFDIARHNDLRCQPSTLLGTMTQDVNLWNIAWENSLRCQLSWHYLANHPKVSILMALLEKNDSRCRMYYNFFVWAHQKQVVFDLCPINDPHACAKRGSCRHLILFELKINKTQSTQIKESTR